MMMTPSDIEIMLHFHGSSDPHPRSSYPAVKEGITKLSNDGLITFIKMDGGFEVYAATERGRAYVAMLCAMVVPTNSWINRKAGLIFVDGKIIHSEGIRHGS